ncbi:YfaP family protein [Shewanella gelidii]|uniref:Cadherin domain-containing protein n=1 Tax=Shewanella gelidii TaxID=1642821 RepID=A0A917JIC7_9GAMM|nr:putative Ig domain-containing protein [Shewanella gelidii]MCL1096819.1 putative Ig domain-containing protein [Shewanella gelidii]GGI70380.1 hypothetical protein GCM10009332_04570 [Shewanella gelidii]
MDLIPILRTTAIASALSIAITGCGGSSSSSEQEQPSSSSANVAPSISSTAVVAAVEDIQYTYQVAVTDPDDENNGTDLTFSLMNAPSGMTVSTTGLIEWLPTEGVLNSGDVTISVTDGGEDNAATASQTFAIAVTPVNDAPTVSAVMAQSVDAGDTFNYQLVVNDVDDTDIQNDISFELVSGPATMSISPTGAISYLSSATQTNVSNVVIRIADGGEDSAQPADVEFALNERFFLTLSGTTVNYFNGIPIEAGRIELSNGAEIVAEATSNNLGEFQTKIQDTKLSERLTLTADAAGYAEAALSMAQNEVAQSHRLLLQPVHGNVTFDATQATDLSVENTVLVSLPENSLVDANGNPATTAVAAELTIINPAIDIEMMPGDMVTTNPAGETVPIESFGAITVTFEDENGAPLQLASDKTAVINIPVAGTTPPATIPLYYYDSVTGKWIEEGEASLTNINGEQFYQGQVSHFTTWNADRIYDTVIINGCVVDEQDTPLNNARIISDGRDYLGRSTTYSNDDGSFSIQVRMNSTILLSATIGFQSRTVEISSHDIDTDLEECLVLSEALTKITLNWGDEPSDLDSHLIIRNETQELGHVYFANETVTLGESIIFLDVDDTNSYGPEVISIPDFPEVATYSYYVHNYSEDPAMEAETTRVEVIFENEQYLFAPPSEDISLWWHVAEIEKTVDGQLTFTPINAWTDDPTQIEMEFAQPVSAVISKPQFNAIVKGLIKNKYYKQ